MTTYIYKDELYHHGIKGQRWGVRRYQNSDGSLTPEGQKRYGTAFENPKTSRAEYKKQIKEAKSNRLSRDRKIQDDYDRGERSIEKNYKRYQNLSDEDYRREERLDLNAQSKWKQSKNKYKEDVARAKDLRRGINREELNKNIKDYSKTFNEASETSDAADELWNKAAEQYKSLAKTPFGRIREVSKAQRGKGSEAAAKYIETWDKASSTADRADELWKEAKEKFGKTGRNYIERVYNNIEYDIRQNRKKG